MAGPENNRGSSSMDCGDDPPVLSVTLNKLRDLPKKTRRWSNDHSPVDILLLTVEDCEFLACYYYLSNPFKSYEKSIGHVYFGQMGEDEDESLKVALVKCSKGSSDPGGSQTVAKNAVTLLRPKATFSVGFCNSLNPEKAKLGDVVISSKLTTDSYKTPVSRNVGNLVRNAADGWEAPLENPETREVKVHCDGEILSSSDLIGAEQQRQLHPEAIAVEMEGKGLFAAAHDLKMEWVVVKGVCDFADGGGSTNESRKTFACVMAASVVSNMLSNPFVFAEWSHYEDMSAGEESSSTCSVDPSNPKRKRLAEPFDQECQKQLQSVYATNSKVKTYPWDTCFSVHLNEIYTKLSWVKDDSKASGVTHVKLEDYTDILKPDKYHSNPNRILVYGPPGIGKTVFTQKITYDWSQWTKEVLKKFQLALLIKLRDVCNLQDIPAILTASELLARDGSISVDDLYDFVRKNQEKVLLILDGFDEYSFEGNSSPIVDIWEGRLLRDCHVIVTTREVKYDKLIKRSHVQFKINGFDSFEQIEEFARKRLNDGEKFEEFYLYLENKDLKSMAEIPLLLLMLCIIWNERYREGLPTSRADIYTKFIQTLLHHKVEKDATPEQFVKVDDYNEDLIKLGKFAFDALLEDSLYLPCSKLPKDISIKLEKLIEVGLFQILNVSSLNPEKGLYFIHKSVQEFLAAKYLAEELLSMNGDNTTIQSKVNSFQKCVKMLEVLKFTCELSEEAACAVFGHLGSVGRKENLSEFEFSESHSPANFSYYQKVFLRLISHSYFCCPPEKREDLYSLFLSYTGGVLFLDSNKANILAKEHSLKSAVSPVFIFFFDLDKSSEQSYRDLITLTEDVNAVVATCSGEKKAADFLKKHPWRPLDEFFLKKERKTNLYISEIIKSKYPYPDTLPTEMLRELISPPESTQKSGVSDQTNEQDINETASCLTENTDSTTGPTPHCLSCVWQIITVDTERQEMETLFEVLPFVTSPQVIHIYSKDVEAKDSQWTETLVSRINFTNRLGELLLININLTARPAAFIARSLYQAPNLLSLDLSDNPSLGEGVSVLTRHLRCVTDLEQLDLDGVMMTKEQVNDLTKAVRQSNISFFRTSYHDLEGNLKPEHEWPTEEYWRRRWKVSYGSEDEPDPGSVTESDDEQEPGSVIESDDEQGPG